MRAPLSIGLLASSPVDVGGGFTAEGLLISYLQTAVNEADTLSTYWVSQASNRTTASDALGYLHIKTSLITRLRAAVGHNSRLWRLFPKFAKTPYGIERRLIEDRVDLVVALSLDQFLQDLICIPYVVPVWDTGHIDLVEFPETSKFRVFEERQEIYSRIVPRAAAVIVESELGAKRVQELYGVPIEKIVVLPFTVTVHETHIERSSKGFALYPAQFWKHKNHATLLYALQRIQQRRGSARKLIFTGSDKGNMASIRELARELDVEEHVEFRGFIPRAELEKLYASADVTLMPSLLGPTNLPPLESLAHGCPTVLTIEQKNYEQEYEGMNFLNAFDSEAWSRYLDASVEIPRVSVSVFKGQMDELWTRNVATLESCINRLGNRIQRSRD